MRERGGVASQLIGVGADADQDRGVVSPEEARNLGDAVMALGVIPNTPPGFPSCGGDGLRAIATTEFLEEDATKVAERDDELEKVAYAKRLDDKGNGDHRYRSEGVVELVVEPVHDDLCVLREGGLQCAGKRREQVSTSQFEIRIAWEVGLRTIQHRVTNAKTGGEGDESSVRRCKKTENGFVAELT